jgi:sulfite exporter TauE/SafE
MTAVITGFVMGFGASLGCMATCVPVLVPYTAAMEKPSILNGLSLAFLFSIGRLIAYAGLLAILVAVKEFTAISPAVAAAAALISGIILVISGLVALQVFNQPTAVNRILCSHVAGAKSPLYLGLLAGIKPCGPLVAAMAFMLSLPGVADMGIFMLFFWLASSVILLTIGAFSGWLASVMGQRLGVDRMRRISGIAMVVIGILIAIQATGLLLY